jgi:hypothetical protein
MKCRGVDSPVGVRAESTDVAVAIRVRCVMIVCLVDDRVLVDAAAIDNSRCCIIWRVVGKSGKRAVAGAGPYSTGGGGTVFEHRYSAVLLTYLLTGGPVPTLGDSVTPRQITLQASDFSAVDDIVVSGQLPDGQQRTLSIAVRHDPKIVLSETSTVKLVGTFLQVVRDHWSEVESGLWRLGLAVADPNVPARQVERLAQIARHSPEPRLFRRAVRRARLTNRPVRDRLTQLDAIVAAAAVDVGVQTVPASELTWRLLWGLWPVQVRVEGTDERDRSDAVRRLRGETRAQTLDAADAVFTRLAELTGTYAPEGATVTEAVLRRDLIGVPLRRASTHHQGWAVLDRLSAQLRDHTGTALSGPGGDLELARDEARQELARVLTAAGEGRTVVVSGEPDVGKSSLTLRVVEDLQASGAGVAAVSLAELPDTTVGLEMALGAGIGEVLAGVAVDTIRLLVIDGAETVLEGRDHLLVDVAAAALRAGLGVAAVTRFEAAEKVTELLTRSARLVNPAAGGPTNHVVPPLDATQTGEVVRTFPTLVRLSRDRRSAWVLGRPGLVALLLRAGTRSLPDGPLSEADVFAAIWHGLVRRDGATPYRGPAPEVREHALLALARGALSGNGGVEPGPWVSALPALRSDALVRPASVWSPGEQFASDLVRDLALARLLITEGWQPLREAGMPRWALRAVRLACQARLIHAGADVAIEFAEQAALFDRLGETAGQRWAELPWEALLTLGAARDALITAWPMLLADKAHGLGVVLRLASNHYCVRSATEHVGDSRVLAPLVELLYCRPEDTRPDLPADPGLGGRIHALVLAWLRGLITENAPPNTLRAAVRDTALAHDPVGASQFTVEVLALLGSDLDGRAEAVLRGLADQGGAALGPAVDSTHAALGLVGTHPDLLLVLTESYYIDVVPESTRDAGMLRVGRSRWSEEGGIRPHRDAGSPMAAWWRGPFVVLLRARPAEGMALIQRMLNHAARCWVRRPGHYMDSEPGREPDGLELVFPDGTSHWCLGDASLWQWYRGSASVVSPCVSALLAMERHADRLIDQNGQPIDAVVGQLLQGCENLAMPALVVGVLVRHLESAGTALDRWLAQPQAWFLESGRRASEGLRHVQGPDGPDVHGRDRRTATFVEVAASLVATGLLRRDQDRLAVLRELGTELVTRAEAEAAPSGEDVGSPVAGWASQLDADNYYVEQVDGVPVVRYEPPSQIQADQADLVRDLDRGQQATRLVMTYGWREDRATRSDTILADIVLARALLDDPPGFGLSAVEGAAAAAASALVGHARAEIDLDTDDIHWAIEVMQDIALASRPGDFSASTDLNPTGADRSAAVGLPAVLLPRYAAIDFDRASVRRALISCATSMFNETRRAVAVGLAPLWATPCAVDGPLSSCHHEIAWAAIDAGVRDCRLGPWTQSRRRAVAPIDGSLVEQLPQIDIDRLLVDRFTAPIVACFAATRHDTCVTARAAELLDVLLATHRRGAIHWSNQGYAPDNNEDHLRVVGVLVRAAADGDRAPLLAHLETYTGSEPALRQLLRDSSQNYTRDADLRATLPDTWPVIMRTVLDHVDAADRPQITYSKALAELIPVPIQPVMDTTGETLVAATTAWIDPEALRTDILRWLPLVRANADALDALIVLARTATTKWQATTGLDWVDQLVNDNYRAVATRSWFLARWLGDLQSGDCLTTPTTDVVHRLLDGIAAAGDQRAVAIQRIRE